MPHESTQFFSWLRDGILDSELATLTRTLPKLEDAVYHTYTQHTMTPSTMKDLALAIPVISEKLANLATVLNHEVAHYPNVTSLVPATRNLTFDEALLRAKDDCSVFLDRNGSPITAPLLQQQLLSCMSSAGKLAAMNGTKFLGLQTTPMPSMGEIGANAKAVLAKATATQSGFETVQDCITLTLSQGRMTGSNALKSFL